MNNPAQNNDISTFMNETPFCQGCDWFLVCYPRRRKRNGIIFGWFRTQVSKEMAAVIEVSCSEPPFDSSVFFFQVYQLRHICSGPNNYERLTAF